MTYVIHYTELSKPRVAWTDDPVEFMESLPDEESAFPVEDEEGLDKIPMKALVSLYNAGTPGAPLKKFEDRAKARVRTWPVLARLAVHEREAPQVKEAVAEAIAEQPEAAPTPTPAPEGKSSPAKGKRLGVGRRMAELIREGFGTKEILEKIHSEFPDSRARSSDVSIARSKVKKGDL